MSKIELDVVGLCMDVVGDIPPKLVWIGIYICENVFWILRQLLTYQLLYVAYHTLYYEMLIKIKLISC